MSSSNPSLRQIVDNEFPHSDFEEESEFPDTPKSRSETDYEFKPDSPTIEGSQLKITRRPDAGGGSSIEAMSFYDARDIKNNHWKVVFPVGKNQCHRVAAALSIFSKETTDTQGNLLSAELSAQVCSLMLDDMDKDTALNSISSLYSIYRPEDITDGYFRLSRLELRKWYDRKATLTPETRPIKISFRSSEQLKRALELDQDTENSPPAKQNSPAAKTKLVCTEAIQVQSSPINGLFRRSLSDPWITHRPETPTRGPSPTVTAGTLPQGALKALGNDSSQIS